ncbi:MAG: hypothetical protein HF978_16330 [Desulfobacteraceae bacterium]|nr:hypothetical protein [Desulfobacteraceae bacterium]MBC2757111.1 hypothetical protein [Desulfobacteraceae bacterium]
MLKHTLEKIETKIKYSPNIPKDKKKEYFELLNELNADINELSKTQKETAESIKGFTKISAHEATRDQIDPNLVRISLEGLSSSVKELHASYPKLVNTVNSICSFLSKIGI